MLISKELEQKPLYSLSIGEFVQLLQTTGENNEEKKEYGKYLSFSELQELTGYARQTLYQLSAAKKIPGAHKLGKRVLFECSVIFDWIESSKVATSSETLQMLSRRDRHGR